jgi:hypothetical protein
LKDDSKPKVKMATQAQIDAFEEAVRQYHDRPVEFIPRTEAGTMYGGVDLMDRMKKSEKESSANTSTVTMPFSFHLRSGSKVGQITCGGHSAATCADCPIDSNGKNNGQGWCNGVSRVSFSSPTALLMSVSTHATLFLLGLHLGCCRWHLWGCN